LTPSAPPPVDQAEPDTIKFGAVLSLTGSLDYLGGPEEKGCAWRRTR
jgi:hypothetical protein